MRFGSSQSDRYRYRYGRWRSSVERTTTDAYTPNDRSYTRAYTPLTNTHARQRGRGVNDVDRVRYWSAGSSTEEAFGGGRSAPSACQDNRQNLPFGTGGGGVKRQRARSPSRARSTPPEAVPPPTSSTSPPSPHYTRHAARAPDRLTATADNRYHPCPRHHIILLRLKTKQKKPIPLQTTLAGG
jgi:hypothetical protein